MKRGHIKEFPGKQTHKGIFSRNRAQTAGQVSEDPVLHSLTRARGLGAEGRGPKAGAGGGGRGPGARSRGPGVRGREMGPGGLGLGPGAGGRGPRPHGEPAALGRVHGARGRGPRGGTGFMCERSREGSGCVSMQPPRATSSRLPPPPGSCISCFEPTSNRANFLTSLC